ncbi:MAG: ABC transporter permease, partial [Hungatella sp.]
IAAESLGGGMPFGAALSAFFFGIADSLSNVLQSFKIPAELVLIIPYLATIVGLSVYSARKQGQEKRKIEKNRLKEEAV